jgi:hypothetical protein
MSTVCVTQKQYKNNLEFEFDIHHNFTKYLNRSMLHEAGYDSFLTGIVFASICKKLEFNYFLEYTK